MGRRQLGEELEEAQRPTDRVRGALRRASALVTKDLAHSAREPRHLALGQTRAGRQLLVVFTIRGQRLRVISARDMSRRERSAYEKARAEEEREDPASDPTLR